MLMTVYLTGANSVEEGIELQSQLQNLFSEADFSCGSGIQVIQPFIKQFLLIFETLKPLSPFPSLKRFTQERLELNDILFLITSD